MEEYKFEFIIIPESYEYHENEIIYRINIDKQLIIERSLPSLELKQAIKDSFFLKIPIAQRGVTISFYNLYEKKAKIHKIYINGISFDKDIKVIVYKGLNFIIEREINKLRKF